MKRILFICGIGWVFAWNVLGLESGQRTLRKERWASADFSKIDFTAIEAEIQARLPGEDPASLSQLLRRNLQHVFYNRLNRDRFLVPPRPQDVAERVRVLLQLNREIGRSIESGRQYLGQDQVAERAVQRKIIREIEETAKKLRRHFDEFFVESREATFSFHIPKSDNEARFFHFVRQADQINRRLTREMDAYFLAESPGAIHLADYKKVTISVLTESLERLCKISRRGL